MEKSKHQEYRDHLADKLKGLRSSDDEHSDLSRSKAEGYLEAKKETDEYQDSKRKHLKDVENFLPTKPESIVRMLNEIEVEDERVEKVAELVRNGIEVPQDIIDYTFEYLKNHIQDEYYRKVVAKPVNIPPNSGGPTHQDNISYFLESTNRWGEVISILESADTEFSIGEAIRLSYRNGMVEKTLELYLKLQNKYRDLPFHESAARDISAPIAENLEKLGRVDEAKELLLREGINDNLFELALRTNDKELAERVYEEHYTPEKLLPLLDKWRAPGGSASSIGYSVMRELDQKMIKGFSFYGLRQENIELLIKVATFLGKTADIEAWEKELRRKIARKARIAS